MYPQPVGQGSVSYPAVVDVAGAGSAYGQGSYRSASYWSGDSNGGGVEDPNYSSSAYGGAARHSPVPNVQFGECGDGSIPRFRVLHEPPSSSPEEVVLQIGMDGVKLFSKSGTTLRIYPLETITRWAIRDRVVFVFWSKNQADRDAHAVTIRSDEPTSGAILDVITAACVQLSEMIEEDNAPREEPRAEEPAPAAARPTGPLEEKETREHWVPDSAVTTCQGCTSSFTAFRRRHHCRSCGGLFCDRCTQGRISLLGSQPSEKVRVCDRCAAEAIMREEAEKEPYRPSPPSEPARTSEQPRSHQDLARRLEQQMGASQQHTQSRPPREVVCDAYASQVYGGGGGGYSHNGGGGGVVPPLVDVGAAYGAGVGGGGGHRLGGSAVPSGPPHLWSQSPPSAPPPMHMSAPSAPGVGYGAPAPAQRQQEVMCPTCQTRLQVMVGQQDVPVECGVCHAAFLVAGSG